MRIISHYLLIFVISSSIYSQNPEKIRNNLKLINKQRDNISLKLIKTWGDENDEDCILRSPAQIMIQNGEACILDAGEHSLGIYDKNGGFIRKIGSKGKGPGDLCSPQSFTITPGGNILINDFGNRRLQLFKYDGSHLRSIKTDYHLFSGIFTLTDNTLIHKNHNRERKTGGVIIIRNFQGTILANIGKNMLSPRIDLPWAGGKYDSFIINYNSNNQCFYTAYKHSGMIHQFSRSGKFSRAVFYETEFNNPDLFWNKKINNFSLSDTQKEYSECVAIDTDKKGNIFVVVTTRPRKTEETVSIVMTNGNMRTSPLKKTFPDKTDLYKLIVFSAQGRVLASKKLEIFCNSIYLNKNRIFLIDKTFERVIYEYQYSIHKTTD